jgi:hypothetical protein
MLTHGLLEMPKYKKIHVQSSDQLVMFSLLWSQYSGNLNTALIWYLNSLSWLETSIQLPDHSRIRWTEPDHRFVWTVFCRLITGLEFKWPFNFPTGYQTAKDCLDKLSGIWMVLSSIYQNWKSPDLFFGSLQISGFQIPTVLDYVSINQISAWSSHQNILSDLDRSAQILCQGFRSCPNCHLIFLWSRLDLTTRPSNLRLMAQSSIQMVAAYLVYSHGHSMAL